LNKSLSNSQISFIVFCYTIGYGIVSLPKNTAMNLGTSGWIAIVIGDLILLFSAFLFLYLAKTFNNNTIYEYSEILTGKLITYIIIFIFCIYSISTASIITRLSAETIKLTILINTPSWALSLILLSVVLYTLINEINILGRVFQVIGIFVLITIFFTPVIIFTQGDITNIKPFFSGDIKSMIDTLPSIIFPFVGIEILSVIPLDFKKNNKHISLYIALTILLIGILYVMIVESCISVMGTKSIINYEDALFATIRRIEFDFLQFLKRFDSIFVITRLFIIYSSIVLSLYIPVYLLNKLFPSIYRNYIVITVIIITYVSGLIPKTMDALRTILNYVGYISIIVIIVIPLLLSIITLIKKNRNNNAL
jgi:spore germination protein